MTTRLDPHGAYRRGAACNLVVDGVGRTGYHGETVAAVLLSTGRRAWRWSPSGQPRGLYCGMGICYECLVTVDGVDNVRACLTPVHDGMVVQTAPGAPAEGDRDDG